MYCSWIICTSECVTSSKYQTLLLLTCEIMNYKNCTDGDALDAHFHSLLVCTDAWVMCLTDTPIFFFKSDWFCLFCAVIDPIVNCIWLYISVARPFEIHLLTIIIFALSICLNIPNNDVFMNRYMPMKEGVYMKLMKLNYVNKMYTPVITNYLIFTSL